MIVTAVVLAPPVCSARIEVSCDRSRAVQCHDAAAAGRVKTTGCEPEHPVPSVAVNMLVPELLVPIKVPLPPVHPPLATDGAVELPHTLPAVPPVNLPDVPVISAVVPVTLAVETLLARIEL